MCSQGTTIAAKKLVLIEDNLDLRTCFRRVLSHAGYEVLTARDGEEGLSRVRECHPDLILLDMLLPKRSGLEVLRAVKADPATALIPVLVLSNLQHSEDCQVLLQGAAEYILKSHLGDGDDLILAVERVLRATKL
jgi:DNA-binding response OmpR family regulator